MPCWAMLCHAMLCCAVLGEIISAAKLDDGVRPGPHASLSSGSAVTVLFIGTEHSIAWHSTA